MEEVWKRIEQDPRYEISNLGRFRHGDRILRFKYDRKGYCQVSTGGKKGRKNFRVHRLVAEAFIPNPEGKSQVNHKDGNKQNNRVDNLEWVTGSENMRHAYANGLKKAPTKLVIRNDGVVYASVSNAAEAIGVRQGEVSNALLGRGYSLMGHTFQFFDATKGAEGIDSAIKSLEEIKRLLYGAEKEVD